VVVSGGVAVPVATVLTTDIDVVLAGVVGGVPPAALRAVTVDISPLLLEAVIRSAPELPQVAVIRIVPRAATDPLLARSPAHLVERLIRHRFTVAGGHDLLGNELCPLDDAAVADVCASLVRAEVRHVAIVAAGSQARPQHERSVADAIQAAIPGARISAASEFGGQGLVAREATVVLDCALGELTDTVLGRCERALRRRAPGVPLRVARGDGGFSTPSRIRALPSVALGATDAAVLCGAAYLTGLQDCRVLLPRSTGQVAGDVRNGLPVVRSGQLRDLGTELVVPTTVLAPDPGRVDHRDVMRVTDIPVIFAGGDAEELACVGAAVSQPTGWLDEVAFIESAAQLEGARRDAEERATAIVMANGAAPGTTYLVESSSVAVPYSPSGTVRIRVRVAGASDVAKPHQERR
jgi:hypothetical protein